MDMFETATRKKFRFESPVGLLTVEDLWDLPLTTPNPTKPRANLDDIAKGLHRQLKNDDNVSFVVKERKSDPTVQMQFDIVRHIIEVRLAEKEARDQEQAKATEKQKLLEILSGKQDEELRSLPVEELKQRIAALS